MSDVQDFLSEIHAEQPRPSFDEACAEVRAATFEDDEGLEFLLEIDNGEAGYVIDAAMEIKWSHADDWNEIWDQDWSEDEDDADEESLSDPNAELEEMLTMGIGRAATPAATHVLQPTSSLVGKQVRVHSLSGRMELNGRDGWAHSWDADRGRYAVELAGGGTVALRPENLTKLADHSVQQAGGSADDKLVTSVVPNVKDTRGEIIQAYYWY